jgi:RHS repeat-associated protein
MKPGVGGRHRPSLKRSAGRTFIAALAAIALQATTAAMVSAAPIQPAQNPMSSQFAQQGIDPPYRPKAKAGTSYASPTKPQSSSKPIEKLNLRTRDSRTFISGGGALTTNLYAQSVNYRVAGGAWQSIDDTLVKLKPGKYAYQNKANRYSVELPADIGAQPIDVQLGSSRFSFSLQGAKGPIKVTGNTATFAGALKGVSVVLAAQPDRVEESLVLASGSAPSSFSYIVQLSPGLALEQKPDGLEIVDRFGTSVFSFAAPAMYDSAGSTANGPEALSMTATRHGSSTTVTLTADSSWLADPARVWPVTIDPAVMLADSQDCYITGGSSAGTKFCGATNLNVGFDGSAASRALMQFNLASIPSTDRVSSAKLFMYLGSATTSNAVTLSLYQLTRTWTTNATWNKYDGTNSWATSGGDFNATAAATTSGIATTGKWYTWTPTSLVQGWLNGSIANDGLILKEPTENVSNVLSFNSATGADPPYLQVVHQAGGSTPASYSSTVLADSPVAYWHLDESSGSNMADARGVDSGTYQGGYTLAQPALIQPAAGTSVTLNGSTGYGTAASLTALQGDNTRSIELWFQTSSATAQSLFDAGAAIGNSNQMFSLIVTPQGWVGNNPPAGISTPGLYLALWGQDIYFPGLYLEDGKRHHVVLELSGNNVWLYVDGTTPGGYFTNTGGADTFAGSWSNRYLSQQPISLTTTPNTASNPILIGNGRYGPPSFNGKLDEVAVYATALSSTQVQNHWQAGNGLPWLPTSVTATAGANQATVSWTAPIFNASGITGYVITPQVGTTLRTPITFNSTATSEVITNLSAGTAYTFFVTAFNSLGLGMPSNASSSATPTGSALPLYEDTVLADAPVGFWPLGETNANVATDLTQTFDGQDFGSYTQGDAGPVVRFANKALNLSGSNAYVRLNHTALLEPSVDSVEVWLKPTSVPSNDTTVLVSPQPGNSEWSSNGYVMTYDGSNNGQGGKISWAGITTSAALPLGVWSYVVGTNDGAGVRIYVNGQQTGAGTGSAPNYGGSANFDAQITRYTFPGDIADVAIYSTVLSASQIGAHFAAAGYAPGPVSNLVATASSNSASLTWTTPSYSGTSAITSYVVTPIIRGRAGTPIAVGGNGTGANIPNLPGSASVTFQVQAANASGPGVIVLSSAVTVGAPTAAPGGFHTYLYMRGGPNDVSAWAHYGLVSRNNVSALATWTIEGRLWGVNSMSTTGGHATIGFLSGTTSNPTDQNPIAGIYLDTSGTRSSFVWPGGSCQITPADAYGIPLAFDGPTTVPAHVALTYDGSTVRGFINGTLVSGCSVATGAAALSAAPFGYMDNSGLNQAYFDEFRVSSGARWTANFTPATQEYSVDGNTQLLWHFDDYAITKLPSVHIIASLGDGVGFPITIAPSTFFDATTNLNDANTVWGSGGSGVGDDWRRPYSLANGVSADELVGGESPWHCACTRPTGQPVDDETGELYHTYADIDIPGRVPLAFTRTYSSLRTTTLGPTGYGWTDDYNQYLSFDGSGNATVHAANGSAVFFTFSAPSTYTAPTGEHVTLVKNGDATFTLTDEVKNQTVFNVQSGTTSTLAKFVDRHGYTTTLAYNGDGTLATVTDPAGRALTFAYTTIGSTKLISSVTDNASRVVAFQYGTNSGDPTTYLSLTQVTDIGTGLTHFTYDANHYLLTMTDPNGGVTTNVYDPSTHQVTSQTDAMNRKTTFAYSGGVTTITDPKGNVTVEEYLNGMLLSRTVAYGTSQAATWTYAFDAGAMALAAVVGPNGETTTTVRDANANVLSVTDGLGRTTTSTYNSFNQPLTTIDPLSVTTTNTYTSDGDLATTSRPLVGGGQTRTTTYTYGDANHPGDVTSMTDPDGKVWTYTYDSYGDSISLTDPVGDKTTYTFDAVGRPLTRVSPNGNVTGGNPSAYTTSYTTNAFGDLLTVVDPLGETTTNTYDGDRNLATSKDPNLHTTTYTYDLDNEQTKVTRPDTTTQQTSYDSDGEVSSQTNGLNHATTYTYDPLGNRITMTDALNRTTTYSYDGNSNLVSLVDPSSRTTSYRYDAANQLTAVTYSDGTTPNVTYAYDADGQRTSMTDGTGSSAYSYDSLHRLVQSVNGNNKTLGYAYNLRGLLTTLTYPGSLAVTRGYDSAGRLTSVADWLTHTTTFAYDADSNLTTETYANGTIGTFAFDAADRVSSTVDSLSGTQFLSLTYHRDADGQLTQGSATQQYGYDTTNRVNSWTNSGASTSYGYDAADDFTTITGAATTTMGYDFAGQVGTFVTTSGGNTTQNLSYTYDTEGNRTQATDNIAHTSTTLGYDQANRLKSYGSSATYQYDGNGLRASKVVSGTTTNYAWDLSGGLPLMILANNTDWIYGPGGVVLEEIVPTNTIYYYHQDQLGSTRKVTDSTGTVVRSYTFDPWGNVSSTTGTLSTPFQFAGQYTDMESGLNYLRSRYFDPTTAQFSSVDRIAAQTRQRYSYTADNPINATDPTGLWCGWLQGTAGIDLGLGNPLISQNGNLGWGSCSPNSNGAAGLQSSLPFSFGSHCFVPDSSFLGSPADPNDADKGYFSVSAVAGIGVGIGFSNADYASQLTSIPDYWSLAVPIPRVPFLGVQVTWGEHNGIWNVTVSPTLGLWAGLTHGRSDASVKTDSVWPW